MAYKHGVYVTEQATSIVAPIVGTAGLQVVFGTAPVNQVPYNTIAGGVVNTPILAYTYKEAVQKLGFSYSFKDYTLCESIYACFQVVGVSPIVLINVLDPAKHRTAIESSTLTVADGVALLDEEGVLCDTLTVKNGDTALVSGTDYVTEFNDDGTVNIALVDSTVTSVTVSGYKLDPSAVEAKTIVGGVNANTGAETGIEVVRQVYPKLAMTPGILLAPEWSKDSAVCAALQAKTTGLNGCFRTFVCADIDSSSEGAVQYTDVKTQKEKQGLSSEHACAGWLYGKVGDYLISPSALIAAKLAYVDVQMGDIPYDAVDNQTISISAACLEDGTEVLLDQEQANVVNSYGVVTFLNVNGWRCWGSNTVAYPSTTDPKDRWINIRRFITWSGNTFILTYFQKVGRPANKKLIQTIVQSENIRGNSFVARGICARYEIQFLEDENPTTDLINGKITFHQYISPFPPAEDIEDIIEYDADAISTALTA